MRRIQLLLGTLALMVVVGPYATSQADYTFDVIARRGMSLDRIGLAGALGNGPSIINAGTVAFTACNGAGCSADPCPAPGSEGVFVSDGTTIVERAHLIDSFAYAFGHNVTDLTKCFSFGQQLQVRGLVSRCGRIQTLADRVGSS